MKDLFTESELRSLRMMGKDNILSAVKACVHTVCAQSIEDLRKRDIADKRRGTAGKRGVAPRRREFFTVYLDSETVERAMLLFGGDISAAIKDGIYRAVAERNREQHKKLSTDI